MSADDVEQLLQNNRAWAQRTTEADPDSFKRTAAGQTPRYMWIGCADSRVPPNTIVDLAPGEIFVHRNIGNVVAHSDLNCLSAIQFGVDVLRARHLIICGHYDCGGVRAATTETGPDLVDHWIRPIKEIRDRYETHLCDIDDEERRVDRLCELNVVGQVRNACRLAPIRDAWARAQRLTLHGFIYCVRRGLLHNLHVSISSGDEAELVAEPRGLVPRQIERA